MIDISHLPTAFENQLTTHLLIQEIILFYPVILVLRFTVCRNVTSGTCEKLRK